MFWTAQMLPQASRQHSFDKLVAGESPGESQKIGMFNDYTVYESQSMIAEIATNIVPLVWCNS